MPSYASFSTTDDYVSSLMMKEIAKTSVISKEDEQALFKEYEVASYERKQYIKTLLVQANIRFVLKVALYYKNRMSIDLNEIVSEGKIGLLLAIDLFDWRSNNKFISFAVWQIKCRISKYLEESDLIRLPSHQKVKLNKAIRNADMDQFDPDIQYLSQITQTPLSFDAPIGDSEMTVEDTVYDTSLETFEDLHIRNTARVQLEDLLQNTLTPPEFAVITNLYGLCGREAITLRETKDIIGKSHERVRQLRDRALRKLAKHKDMVVFESMFMETPTE